MVFLYATALSLIKLIFYIKNKNAVDLKLNRINRNNSFSRYFPKRINVTIFVRYYLYSRVKMLCKKVFWEICQNWQENTCAEVSF